MDRKPEAIESRFARNDEVLEKAMSKKFLGALVALTMMGVGPAPADAGETTVLPGCYGAVVTVCDLTVSTYGGVQVTQTQYPVCAGSCTMVDGPGVSLGGLGYTEACVSRSSYQGAETANCVSVDTAGGDAGVCAYDNYGSYRCLPPQ